MNISINAMISSKCIILITLFLKNNCANFS